MKQNLFSLANNNLSKADLKEYLISQGLKFKGMNAHCPFHAHNNDSPSLGVKDGDKNPFWHCFACNVGGDITKFVELKENLSPLHAAKKVLRDLGIAFIDEQIEQSDEEKKDIEERNKKLFDQNKIAREKQQAKEKRITDFIQGKVNELAPKLAENYITLYDRCKEDIESNFPNRSAIFEDYAHTYLGYDLEQESIAILIRDGEKVFNIKHKQKFIFDKKLKVLTNERMPGKWLGAPRLNGSLFPIEYFREHEDNRVILCEGEKDALNLLSYGVNVLTLGGVTNSWLSYAKVLKNKTVYIWFDNDAAGYENAIKRYRELESLVENIFIVPFFCINVTFANKYDISDFLADNRLKIGKVDDVFHLIAYSSFKLTNELIDDISDVVGKDLSAYKTISVIKDFRDIKREFLKTDNEERYLYVVGAKGELDNADTDWAMDKLKSVKNTNDFKKFKEIMCAVLTGADKREREADEIADLVEQVLTIKKTLLSNYRQVHIVDMVAALMQLARKSGFSFAEHKGNLYIWSGTHYMQVDNNSMAKWIHSKWMFAAKIDYKKQTRQNADLILENVLSRSLHLDEIKLYQERRVLNFANGTVFISPRGKMTFKEGHSPKDAATNILKFNYSKNATAPKWSKFLKRVLADEDDRKCLMEFIGYCFLPSHAFEAFLFLYGKSGANGKSVILDVIRSFFGEENTSSLQLQQMEGHKLHALTNKIINIGSEIDAKGMNDGQISTLKALVSPKDSIQIDPKNQEPYQLMPKEKPKLAFSGNNKVKQGVDDAFFRRMILITFDGEILDDEKIRDLSDRFADEMNGIFNLAIEGLKRLIGNGKFTKSNKMKASLEEYKDEVNPLRAYIRDNTRDIPTCMVPKKYLYAHYQAWADSKGYRSFGSSAFWGKFKDEAPHVELDKGQIRMKTGTNYEGLSDRVTFAYGVALLSDELDSFKVENSTIKVSSANFCTQTKTPLFDLGEK